jgi:drug/metabolite transporter (DMT)-like permease
MNWKSKLALGVLTALAMLVLTYALPRGGAVREAALVQFPVTVGVWAIFSFAFRETEINASPGAGPSLACGGSSRGG